MVFAGGRALLIQPQAMSMSVDLLQRAHQLSDRIHVL